MFLWQDDLVVDISLFQELIEIGRSFFRCVLVVFLWEVLLYIRFVYFFYLDIFLGIMVIEVRGSWVVDVIKIMGYYFVEEVEWM